MFSPHTRFEEHYGFGQTAGIDEAGCGPWAGPVVAAAVILFPAFLSLPFISAIDDSKRLSPQKREALVTALKKRAENSISSSPAPLVWAVGQASSAEIDALNIRQANFLAMTRALEALPLTPQTILLDGTGGLQTSIPVIPLIKGDQQSLSIATASLFAKVTRDHLMDELALQYPLYDWDKNKGYGTKKHQKALEFYGPTPHHRMSFSPMKAAFFSAS